MWIFMHVAVRSDRGAEEFNQDPPYPAKHVAVAALTLLQKISIVGLAFAFYNTYFDRISRHPLKAAGAGCRLKPFLQSMHLSLCALDNLPAHRRSRCGEGLKCLDGAFAVPIRC